jgi:phage shock protein PspC (stress-responsive transcriptional regulator)
MALFSTLVTLFVAGLGVMIGSYIVSWLCGPSKD